VFGTYVRLGDEIHQARFEGAPRWINIQLIARLAPPGEL
jgi:hypothetical protein